MYYKVMPYFFKLAAKDIPEFENEVSYYVGYRHIKEPNEQISSLIKNACSKMHPVLVPQAVYQEYDLLVKEEQISFADINFCSKDLARNLKNCTKVIIFAATIGAPADMLIRRSQQSGSAESAMMQGCGAMFIESFVDLLNQKLKTEALQKGFKTHQRFSPGYGDVSLELQKDFFRLLPCNKIGLTLMNTLIMAPEKSVTAFIGLEPLE